MPNPLINIGSAANDGTGELGPRAWLQKINRLPISDSTINAGSGDYTGTTEQKITAAIAAAVAAGAKYVWMPQSMLPYNASLVTFNNATQMIREGGNPMFYDVLAYGAAANGTTDDTVAIQAAINAAVADEAGTVLFPSPPAVNASYRITSTLILGGDYIFLVGSGLGSIIDANAVMTNMVSIRKLGTKGTSGGIRDLAFRGRNLASWAIKLDSWHRFEVTNVEVNDMVAGLIDITSDQFVDSEFHTIAHCTSRLGVTGTRSTSFIRARAGSAGRPTEVTIRDCVALDLTGWGIELDDCQRCTVDGFATGNNTTNYSGAVLIRESNTAAGAPATPGAHWINNVYLEALAGGATAICVQVQADAAATRALRECNITNSAVAPPTRTHLNLVNNSGVNGQIANITFAFPRQSLGSPNNIVIGVNCLLTSIVLSGDNNVISGAITDNGSRTKINYGRQAGLGIGGNPNSSVIYRDVGEMFRNTDDGNIFYTSTDGVSRIVSGLRKQTLTDAATIVVDASAGETFYVTLNVAGATRAMGTPTAPSYKRIVFTIIQDGTGGRALTWPAVFKQAWSDTGNTLNKRSSIAFIWDGTNWNQDGAQTPYV